ncbi:MAG: aldehyde dehydrogenase family protein [Devosia sp.]
MQHHRLFLGGEFREAPDATAIACRNPATGEAIGTVATATGADVDMAVALAREAVDRGPWSSSTAAGRAQVLNAIADGIKRRADEIVALEVADGGSTLAKARADVASGAYWFRTMAELAPRLEDAVPLPQTLRPGPSYNYIRREPIGVVAAIVPWNFPFLMACWKLSMGLAAGNAVVLKPALEAPLSALLLAEIVQAAGVPPGIVSVLPGEGPTAGEALVLHPGVDKVSFTGSVEVGKRVMGLAAGTLKRVTLELGGKSAQVLLDGADLDLAIDGALYAAFYHAGQACEAGTRLLVPRALHDEIVSRLVERMSALAVGNPADKATNIGPLINGRQLARVAGYVEIGTAEGASVAAGGARIGGDLAGGSFFAPTLLTGVTSRMRVAQEEIFGPVLSVLAYDDVDEAVAIANDTIYGLAGAVWGPPTAAIELGHRLRAGTVWINDYHLLNPKYPFGGYRQSGIGREFGLEGLLAWTELKHMHVAVDTSRASKRWFDSTIPRRT